MTDTLYVQCEGTRVGTLTREQFAYAPQWLERPDAWALSTSLPLAARPVREVAQHWFGNLLPEGGARERIARRLRIDLADDFELLAALGRECAGALTITDTPEAAPSEVWSMYTRITDKTLEGFVRQPRSLVEVFGEDTRLSLAGAQDKLAVRLHEGKVFLPHAGAASTHILKLPSFDAGLVENEYLCLTLAAAVGLPTVKASLWPTASGPALLVERYDRSADVTPDTGALPTSAPPAPKGSLMLPAIRRLHQEDFAQAHGVSRLHKYQQDGAPSFARCVEMVRHNGAQPALEIRVLLRWFAFCLCIGNRDNHVKNIARVRAEGSRWALAPFYDLVNTSGYKSLSQQFALFVGDDRTMSTISHLSWARQAKELGLSVALVTREVASVIESVQEALPEVSERVANELGDDAKLVQTRRAITKCLRATKKSLTA